MSLLLQLPQELLVYIISYVGPGFFGRDTRNLAISKTWYAIAWTILVVNLELTGRSLVKFTKSLAVLTWDRPRITSVDILLNVRGTEESLAHEWTPQINPTLTTLAGLLQKSPALRCLRLRAVHNIRDRRYRTQNYLMLRPVEDLLSIRHMTSLELDIPIFHSRSQYRDDGIHLCLPVNTLLPSLRRLRWRVGCVCDCLLKLPAQEVPLNLEEVIVSLASYMNVNGNANNRWSVHCLSGKRMSSLPLRSGIDSQATALSHRMKNPRIVRVISINSMEKPFVFDVLTGKRSELIPLIKCFDMEETWT